MRSAPLTAASDWFADRRRAAALASVCARAGAVLQEVTYSLGDALTYRVTASPDCLELTGHRRYLEARYVLDGVLRLEIAPVGSLDPRDEYSDLTDRQHFAGAATAHDVPAGTLVLVDPDEAIRDVELNGSMLVIRVSVEEL